jgi:polyphosphate glucokinase
VRVLVIDVGGTHVKIAGSWDRVTHRIPSGPTMTAADMARAVMELTKGWDYEAISLGYPGPVKDNRPFREPINIAGGWTTFDFQKAFGKPVRVINDAAMQALGSYAGGRMLFLGLGTGLGTSIVDHWRVEPLEVAHLPYRKGKSYEEYLGDAGLQKMGDERWEKHVHKVCDLLRAALLCDGIVLGGGNARKLVTLPDAATRGSNENAIQGGVRLWERVAESTPPEFIDAKTAAETIVVDGERRVGMRRASDRAASGSGSTKNGDGAAADRRSTSPTKKPPVSKVGAKRAGKESKRPATKHVTVAKSAKHDTGSKRRVTKRAS